MRLVRRIQGICSRRGCGRGWRCSWRTQAGQQNGLLYFRAAPRCAKDFWGMRLRRGRVRLRLWRCRRGKRWSMGLPSPRRWPAMRQRRRQWQRDWRRRFPEDTSAKFYYVPSLRALAALNRHDPAKAIEWLQLSSPYELGVPQSSFFGFFGAMYPVYVRGEAYLALHQGAQAAAEFQKIVDHRHDRDQRSGGSAGAVATRKSLLDGGRPGQGEGRV